MILNGIILIDKPKVVTSAEVVRQLKRRLFPLKSESSKIGHAGTLDPDATGLLLILLGAATRLQSTFMQGEKSYKGIIKLGIGTDTDDVTGQITNTANIPDIAELQRLLQPIRNKYIGTIEQTPPLYSAVKIAGKRGYALARAGQQFEMTKRTVKISELALSILSSDQLEYEMTCSSGTYVRSLARDIGRDLGTFACAESIRRTSSGNFSVDEALKYEDILCYEPSSEQAASFLKSNIIPLSRITQNFVQFVFSESDCLKLSQGNQSPLSCLRVDPISSEQSKCLKTNMAAALSEKGKLIAILQLNSHQNGEESWEIAFVIATNPDI